MLKRIGTFTSICVLTAVLSGCTPRNMAEAYWQRIEMHSALYMTGPKAQQQLEQNIAGCVREIDELVELEALRETTPPETHSAYHKALKESGDLDYFETPARFKDMRIDHSDFHDFESCMRHKGWERVQYVRYQHADKAKKNYKVTKAIREYGTSSLEEAEEMRREKFKTDDYQRMND
ncbi:MAG: hypothetical protein HND56_05450 [Pseudomonadota bacterium]|nr:hypothetical protein [Pseudomonadota bacterium]QKK05166.1 MAG: hypothetical protein HND56_05450 [Pseudomonadota bacterium]